jgi:FKBP-type peptidyl-prolyl cis-trans isomerase
MFYKREWTKRKDLPQRAERGPQRTRKRAAQEHRPFEAQGKQECPSQLRTSLRHKRRGGWVVGEFPSRDKLVEIFYTGRLGRGRLPCLNTSRMRDSR